MPNFVENIRDALPNYLNHIKSLHGEESKKVYCLNFLEKVFDIKPEDLDFEVHTKSQIFNVSGRIDTLFENILFEFKKNVNNVGMVNDGKTELKKYFQHFLEKTLLKNHVGIITDGVIFKPFQPKIKKNIVESLVPSEELNLSNSTPENILYWFDNYFFKSDKIIPTSQSITTQFGLTSPTFISIYNGLEELFEKVQIYRDVKLKFDNWSTYLEVVFGDKPKGLELFLKHTYLSTLVKLLIHIKISSSEAFTEDAIPPILWGNRFKQAGIMNFFEEDFYTWTMNVAIRKQSSQLFSRLLNQLKVFDLDHLNEDLLKELYQKIVDPDVRQALGEFYTPDWLAKKMVNESLKDNPLKTVLDPACGSGTFLFLTIQSKIEKLKSKGMKKSEILKHITQNVLGYDIHPLAVLISKTNYLLSLQDLIHEKSEPISIPVFLSDSLKIPEEKMEISYGSNVIQFPASDKKFFFPTNIANNIKKLDYILEKMKEHGNSLQQIIDDSKTKTHINLKEVITNLTSSFEKSINDISDSNEKKIILENMKILFELIQSDSDSIWPYILRNMYKPITSVYNKVDLIIGNPPWLQFQKIKNETYQEFVKSKCREYGIVDKRNFQNIANLDLSTTFFSHCVDKYLKTHGMICFVMPQAVLVASQHENFRNFQNPKLKLEKIYDLEDVEPLFRILACVLIGKKGGTTKYPVQKTNISGNLNSLKNLNPKLEDALPLLSFEDVKFNPAIRPKKGGYYYFKFERGAEITPRNFWFVDIKQQSSFLGFDPLKPFVVSSQENQATKRWANIKFEGNIEKQFFSSSVLGPDLVPYGIVKRRLIILPILIENKKIKMISSSESTIINTDFKNYLEKVEKIWKDNATAKLSKKPIYNQINYNDNLIQQNPKSHYKVIYAAGGTNVASCIIDQQKNYEFKINGSSFNVDTFFADMALYYFDTDSEDEAYYLTTILNSRSINNFIKPFQSRGRFGGARNIHKTPLVFEPFPKFDPKNSTHKSLVKIGKKCEKLVSEELKKLHIGKIGFARTKIRDLLSKEYDEIEENIKKL